MGSSSRRDHVSVDKGSHMDLINGILFRSLSSLCLCGLVVFQANGFVFGQDTRAVHAKTAWTETIGSQGFTRTDCPVFAIDSIEIPAKEAGYLAEVIAQQGNEIDKGDWIAKLDSHTAELERTIAVLQHKVAEKEASDDSDVRFAEALVEEAKLSLEGFEKILTKGSASESEIRQRRLGVTQAELKVLSAKQALEQRKLKARVSQASITVAEDRIQRCHIRAPFTGVVTDVLKKQGEWVQPGMAVCRLVRMDELRVDCILNIEQVNPVELVGTTVTVTANRAGQDRPTFSGRIVGYDSEVTALGTIRVHAHVQNYKVGKDWALLPGMMVALRAEPRSQLSRIPDRSKPQR